MEVMPPDPTTAVIILRNCPARVLACESSARIPAVTFPLASVELATCVPMRDWVLLYSVTKP